MGLSAGQLDDARRRPDPDRRSDRGKTKARLRAIGRVAAGLILLVALAVAARADTLRVATWNAPLTRKGPGLLLRDLDRAEDADLAAIVDGLVRLRADVLVLTDFDYDAGGAALRALRAALASRGVDYRHVHASRPNGGMATGRDIDGDGRRGQPRDAQGYGWFAGEGGLAILSRLPVDRGAVRDLSALLWRDLPGSLIADADPGFDVQRLSSTAHWVVPLRLPQGGTLTILTFHATPPVFDGPEDRNGRRNHDEVAVWNLLLDGKLGPAPEPPFVLAGNANLDPKRGEGRHEAIRALLADSRLTDPLPGEATVDWGGTLGPMRVSYVLPSADLEVAGAGVTDTPPEAGRHVPVWVDLAIPD